jgi:hypothetical protein
VQREESQEAGHLSRTYFRLDRRLSRAGHGGSLVVLAEQMTGSLKARSFVAHGPGNPSSYFAHRLRCMAAASRRCGPNLAGPSSVTSHNRRMTLLFTYVDDNYVMQLADEQISVYDPTARRWRVRDDQTAKQVLIGGRIVASFTGVAELDGGEPTPTWLAARLAANLQLDAAIGNVASDLTSLFATRRYRKQLLVVLIAGWVDTPSGLQPIFGHVSNQHPSTYERLPNFDHKVGTLPPGAHWVTRGQPLADDVDLRLRRTLKKALTAGVSPPVAQRLFLEAMRATAAANRFVGKSALVGALPRVAMTQAQADPDHSWVIGNQQGVLMPGFTNFVRVPAGTDRVEPYRPVIV